MDLSAVSWTLCAISPNIKIIRFERYSSFQIPVSYTAQLAEVDMLLPSIITQNAAYNWKKQEIRTHIELNTNITNNLLYLRR
jgi:hypothetical protein